MTVEVNLYLPVPHAKQAEFLFDDYSRKIICAGRRGGKTTGIARLAMEWAISGKRVLEAAPTADQTQAFWDACLTAARDLIAKKIVVVNRSLRLMTFPNGGRIRCKTAWNADTLRGDYADLLILDEYSIMSPDTWDEVGAPMLLDNGGSAVFIFTPKRKNHAYKLYQKAIMDRSGEWKAYHFTSYDNPHLDQKSMSLLVQDMTEAAYKQEILAEFLDSEGLVFKNIDANCILDPEDPDKHKDHIKVMGIDWGKVNDFTAISIACRQCNIEVYVNRFNQVDYNEQLSRIGKIVDRWGGKDRVQIIPERNSIGGPLIDLLTSLDYSILPGPDGALGFNTTYQTKVTLVDGLAISLEQCSIPLQKDREWKTELEMYEGSQSRQTGRMAYTAPEGFHDDTVIARGLMVYAMNSSSGSVLLW